MEIIIKVEDEDLVDSVQLECSPTEALIINKALTVLEKDKDCAEDDRKRIKEMLKVNPRYMKDDWYIKVER